MNESVIIDAMGGDYAPMEILKGAYDAYLRYNTSIILVGSKDKIKKNASDLNIDLNVFKIIDARQEVLMNDHPGDVVKNKKESSIFIGTKLLSENRNRAFISAGNTGAVMACSLFNVKRLEGVLRPAIAIIIPLAENPIVLIDAGANADCKPQYLKQFAFMGKIFSQKILNIGNPKVGLINVGSEEGKGNELSIKSFDLLKEFKEINFQGNIEGRDLFNGSVDVAVCDGFTGNILLKSIEGMAELFFSEIKQVLTANFKFKVCAAILKEPFKNMKKKFDYEEYGGAFLIGINGIVIIAHGSSKAKAITNAVRVAIEGQKGNIVENIAKEFNN
ncbi:MAG: phosphate acyltransferase PlsX [Actinobacteria bacterium]|nr:phosphate acyltransferase PlsX [Actinomycetota bacterium]MCL6087847.1 phosphate acyltransferase PlsX [Actinomycetota bacterium]